MAHHSFDTIIIGSGLAGLSTALELAQTQRVAVITKRTKYDGASGWAQGGIAAVLGDADSFEQHMQDTLIAGAGLCDPHATELVVQGAPAAIAWLRSLGVAFTEESGQIGGQESCRKTSKSRFSTLGTL